MAIKSENLYWIAHYLYKYSKYDTYRIFLFLIDV